MPNCGTCGKWTPYPCDDCGTCVERANRPPQPQQPDLFEGQSLAHLKPTAHARNTDPWPSHEAAANASVNLRPKQRAVWLVFRRHGEPMTHPQLVSVYARWCRREPGAFPPQSESGLRTRCSELVEMGLLRDSGRVVREGRSSFTIWELWR